MSIDPILLAWLIRIAGVLHFGILIASALVPQVLDWRADLKKARPADAASCLDPRRVHRAGDRRLRHDFVVDGRRTRRRRCSGTGRAAALSRCSGWPGLACNSSGSTPPAI